MAGKHLLTPYVCARCAAGVAARRVSPASLTSRSRHYATRNTNPPAPESSEPSSSTVKDAPAAPKEPGPMARRLEEATEEALFSGRAGQRSIEQAGFSEELKERLLNKVKDAQFRSEHAGAFAEAGLTPAAGEGTRRIASSQPWTGQESTEDAVLRMLTDARKPLKPGLRGKPKIPDLQPIDTRLRMASRVSPGRRAASAKDKADMYTGMGMKNAKGLNEKERQDLKNEFRERFRGPAGVMPNSVTGLASLANERIEDAIARGQFKDIPRGKGVERDTRSDNPFIDTTEYIMNKMIKRQEIVPPWIEKQQEVVKTAHVFRSRMRNDWARHAARTIASRGGSLEQQMERARQYARAEEVYNPRKRNVDQISVSSNSTDDPVMVKIRQQISAELATELSPDASQGNPETAVSEPDIVPFSTPFRDPAWEAAERSYMELAINNLNALTRSYNLMAPELAKKPYFSLERELNSCYADVAPKLADTIKERATRPAKNMSEGLGYQPGGILERFGAGSSSTKVYDSKAPHYGLKEMWRDFWKREPSP